LPDPGNAAAGLARCGTKKHPPKQTPRKKGEPARDKHATKKNAGHNAAV
jgi:hypothetical protein